MQTKRIGFAHEIISMILISLIIIGCLFSWATVRTEMVTWVNEIGIDTPFGIINLILAGLCLVLIPATGRHLKIKKGVIVSIGVAILFFSIFAYKYYSNLVGFYRGNWGLILSINIDIGLYIEIFSSLTLIIIGGTFPTKKQSINQKIQPKAGYCVTCGKQNEPEARFCSQCGASL